MAIVNVHLDGELERFISEFVKSGYAGSKAEVIRAALREFEQNQIRAKSPLAHLQEERKSSLRMSEPRMKKIWDNEKEETFWSQYY